MNHGFSITEQLYSRELTLAPDEKKTVFRVTLEEDTPWTIGYQETGVGVGKGKITYSRNLVLLTQEFTFGKFGGDFITGVGPFELELTGGATAGSNVRAFWTKQPYTIDVGSLSDTKSFGSGAAFGNVGNFDGFIPFPYNVVSIFCEATPFTFRLQDSGAGIIQSAMVITPPSEYVLNFRPPPDARLRLSQSSGAAVNVTAVYSRI